MGQSPHHEPGGHLGRNAALVGGGILAVAGGLAGGAAVVSRMDSGDNAHPTDTTIDNPVAGFGQPNGVVDGRTGKSFEITASPTPTETATPEAPFPYELGYTKEYVGPDVTVVFGIEKAAMERPEDNKCSAAGRTYDCPPIKSIELSDKWLREYAPDLYPNGMSEQEMVQRLNDAVLLGQLFNIRIMNPEQKDLTLDGLKELIHQGKAPKYIHPATEGKIIDTSKPVYIVATNDYDREKGMMDSGLGSYLIKEHDGSLVEGLWHGTSFNERSKNYPKAVDLAYSVAKGFVFGADESSAVENTVPIYDLLRPFKGTSTAASIIDIN